MSRIGRPPASDSVETRRRIIDVARRLFGDWGFAVTTTRMVAEEAGMTSAALYHYYPSKSDLFLAVLADCHERVIARIKPAIARGTTFVDRAMALLDATSVMNREDPTLTQFLTSARIDRQRRPELLESTIGADDVWNELVREIIDHGVFTGEVPREHRALTHAFVVSLMIGLADTALMDAHLHRLATDAVRYALRNSLLTPSGTGSAPTPL